VSSSLPFVPLSEGSFGRLGGPALSWLRSLADHVVQAGGPGLSRDGFILGALRKLGVAMCHGNASLGRSGLYVLAEVSGRAPLRGLSCPPAEVVWAWFVWVCLLWPAFVCGWPRLLCVLLLVEPRLLRLSAPML
jgi:hypothetical protein